MSKDPISTAKRVLDIATGVLSKPKPKDHAAVALGSKGGKARAARLTPEERKKASVKALEARYSKK